MKSKTKPFFSIVIPTLNEEKTLPNLLNDLVNQTFKDFEVIVVDAKSEDRTVVYANKFKSKLDIRIIPSQKRNICYQRNSGAKDAKSDWLIFFDADNRLPKYFLQGIKFYTEFLQVSLISCHILPDTKSKKDEALAKLANIAFEIRKNSTSPAILESMIAIKRDVFKKVEGFDETIHWGEGVDLLSRLNKKSYKYDFVKEPKYHYSFRRFRKQTTFKLIRNIAEHEIARLAKIQISREHEKKMYPLEGGKFYEIDKQSKTKINDAFDKIFGNPIVEKIKHKRKSIWEKLKKILS